MLDFRLRINNPASRPLNRLQLKSETNLNNRREFSGTNLSESTRFRSSINKTSGWRVVYKRRNSAEFRRRSGRGNTRRVSANRSEELTPDKRVVKKIAALEVAIPPGVFTRSLDRRLGDSRCRRQNPKLLSKTLQLKACDDETLQNDRR